jgi:glycosyltransferase involved in cell wall biosynthesis
VRAVALVPEARLVQHGPSLTEEERRHRAELESLVAELGVEARVAINGAVPRGEVPGLLAGADALVNNNRAGATDKAVYEAGAGCVPVLASNPALDGFLPEQLRFERDDPEGLAARIRALTAADRSALGRELRARVERDHSVEGWADRIVALAGGERAK